MDSVGRNRVSLVKNERVKGRERGGREIETKREREKERERERERE
jgi:hypothetical protein